MAKELIPYLEMCRREGAGLRRGMNFGLGGTYSVLLMSVQSRAPYQDRFTADGTTLIYEGHDEPQSAAVPHPKAADQPLRTAYGTPTQNAKFHEAAQAHKHEQQPPERVKVYEKCRPGLWLYRGLFHLVDSWQESDGKRQVFRFKLVAVYGQDDDPPLVLPPRPRRSIPRAIKVAVWRRDLEPMARVIPQLRPRVDPLRAVEHVARVGQRRDGVFGRLGAGSGAHCWEVTWRREKLTYRS
jgi:hypothetical protein